MPSFQNSSGSGKAAKFVDANPLGPMADPFAGMGDDQKEYQKAVSENVNNRLNKAIDELKEKHKSGTNEVDDPDLAPTGAAYHAYNEEVKRQRQMHTLETQRKNREEAERLRKIKEQAKNIFKKEEEEDESDSDSDYDDLLEDNDPELDSIRERRLREMRESQMKHAENLAKGHGQYRTILQDEFLPECTGSSEWVAIHFFHNEFERCKILDHHLKIIATNAISCKFLRIDAEKAPFFVDKLKIKTLPTLLVFRDGKAVDRLMGFEGLSSDGDPDKWHTGRLQQWLAKTGAIKYTPPTEEIEEEIRRLGLKPAGSVWSGTAKTGFQSKVYYDDDE